jgi:amino acid transporter
VIRRSLKRSTPVTNVVSVLTTLWIVHLIGVPRDGWWVFGSLAVYLAVGFVVYTVVSKIMDRFRKEREPEPEPQPSEPPRTVSTRQVLGLIAVVTAVIAVLALISSLRGEPKPGPTNMCYVRTPDLSLTTQSGIPWCPPDVTVPN